ncbi:4Fe-4S binding protein [Vallitalea pronyensis]|uniref:Ferredoxin n=1 Tax=Vallitalea pronyensis TaxID=1348613 RepID=A0A8J8SJ84_9FIRM|nr:EFR1 family ferrodoxin [Vallitalea pronyensis]QUI25303.1 4Fe-4S binding protein [Vallitalea pronyensis]
MKITVFYFSGTGNTQLVAQKLQNAFQFMKHHVQLISIEDTDKLRQLNLSKELVGFGYPIYKFSYPEIFNRVLPIIHKHAKSCKYFQFTTYARFTGDATYDFSKKMDSTRFICIGERSFKAPSSGISARRHETDYAYKSVMFFEDHIDEKITAFAENMIQACRHSNEILPHKPSLFHALRRKIVADIEITKYPKLQIDKNRCIGCGLCSRSCPDQNLLQQNGNMTIVDNTACLHCLRCMHHCPKNAISFGVLTKDHNQYTFALRDRLYEASAVGHNPYWHQFNKITRKWKRNTIKYWLTHKGKPEI